MKLRVVLLSVAVLLAVAGPASAWRLERQTLDGEDQLVFRSDAIPPAAGENLVVFLLTNGAGAADDELQYANSEDAFVGTLPTGCQNIGGPNNVIECPAQGVDRMTVHLGFRDDFWSSRGTTTPSTVHGGNGNDFFDSREGPDTLLGEGGSDEIEDDPFPFVDRDTIDGGPGDDTLRNGSGADDIRGGDGVDTVVLESINNDVTLDDVANDGGASGEGDNIHSDVENLDAGSGNDFLAGDGDANLLDGGAGNDELRGNGGPDVLIGGLGADLMLGGAEFDRVSYPEVPTVPAPQGADQRITLDDVADDGTQGEGDNVRADVEDVAAGAGRDFIVGNDDPNVLDGGDGDDDMTGGGGADTLFGGAGFDALRARDGLAERVECNADGGSAIVDTSDTVLGCSPVDASNELIADVDGDGATKPSDCDDADPAIFPGAVDVAENGLDEDCSGADAVNLDRDRDGFPRPADCDDGNGRVNPGARDKPGNRIDEDCRGGPAPFPLLATTIAVTFRFSEAFTEFTALTIRRVRAGSTLRLACRGPGCPFRTRSQKLKRDRRKLSLPRPLRAARLLPGARFEVRLTRRRTVGIIARYTVRAGKAPARRDRCLRPGAKRPTRCPA